MSFLDQVKQKKSQLKPTATILTFLDGTKHLTSCSSSSNETRLLPNAQFGFVVDTKPDNVPARVADNLFIGSQDCCDPQILQESKIVKVLSVGIKAPIQIDGVVYKFVECLDLPETNLLPILKDCSHFIEDALKKQENILVHCNAGVSRSASVVIGYLILNSGYDYFNAYKIVKNCRSCIRPNDGFVKQLKCLNKK